MLTALVPVTSGCSETVEPTAVPAVNHYTYEVVNAYPHDAGAFTQGLAFENGYLYEGTGRNGKSSLRKVQLETGVVFDSVSLPDAYFGEGITVFGDTVVQLTWKSGVGLVYDKNDLRLIRDFAYDTEGWGITCDGQRLIMSAGTSTLYFLDPDTFEVDGHIDVHDLGTATTGLNELEFINGHIFANVWPTDRIAIIDPGDGRVTGWVDLSGLLATRQVSGHVDVLNGIAYDAANDRLFVTGKLWPLLFEIKLVED
jgi:glutamine cyclotransferase